MVTTVSMEGILLSCILLWSKCNEKTWQMDEEGRGKFSKHVRPCFKDYWLGKEHCSMVVGEFMTTYMILCACFPLAEEWNGARVFFAFTLHCSHVCSYPILSFRRLASHSRFCSASPPSSCFWTLYIAPRTPALSSHPCSAIVLPCHLVGQTCLSNVMLQWSCFLIPFRCKCTLKSTYLGVLIKPLWDWLLSNTVWIWMWPMHIQCASNAHHRASTNTHCHASTNTLSVSFRFI